MRKYSFVVVVFIIVISCDEGLTTGSPSDSRYLELAYNNNFQYPDGFYHEIHLGENVYYENTVSIKPVNERERIWIELNTNDKEQAKIWSNLSNTYSSVDREIVRENETEKYFEIVRVNIRDARDTLISRVHRTDYFVPQHDRFTPIDTVGFYNSELSADHVKELVEYLWSCGTLGLYDKVVESKISEKGTSFEHHIQSLQMIYGDFGLHDMIYIYDNYFQLDKSTRVLTVKRHRIKEIQGNYQVSW